MGACKTCNTAKSDMTFDEFLETDYLTGPRRAALGFSKVATVSFKDAQAFHGRMGHWKSFISLVKY